MAFCIMYYVDAGFKVVTQHYGPVSSVYTGLTVPVSWPITGDGLCPWTLVTGRLSWVARGTNCFDEVFLDE